MTAKKPCLRCLLQESDESQLAEVIRQRIATMPAAQKTTPEEYARRLEICRSCDDLISGTCRKCGCYAELRAAKKDSACPNATDRWK